MKIFQARLSINSCILKAYIFVFARNVSGQQVFEPFSTTSIFWGCILISGYSLQPTNYGRRRTTCNMLPSSLPTAGCRSPRQAQLLPNWLHEMAHVNTVFPRSSAAFASRLLIPPNSHYAAIYRADLLHVAS